MIALLIKRSKGHQGVGDGRRVQYLALPPLFGWSRVRLLVDAHVRLMPKLPLIWHQTYQ